MQRLIRVLWIVLLATNGDVAAAAKFDPEKIAAIDKAAGALAELGKDAYKTGTPPRQSDPAVKELLDVVFGTAGLNDGPDPVPFAQIDVINDWLLRVVKTGMIYVFAGTGIADLEKISNLDEKVQAQIAKNTAAFAPEMGRYYDAQLAVSQAEIDMVGSEIAAHPEKFKSSNVTSGLAQMRAGLTHTLIGVVTTFPVAGLDPAWMRERELALIAIAPSAARFLEPESRQQIRAAALQVSETVGDQAVKDGLIAFAKTVMP
jgi:hypothetical protein